MIIMANKIPIQSLKTSPKGDNHYKSYVAGSVPSLEQPEKSQQKCRDNATESGNKKRTFENIKMDNIPRGIKIIVGTVYMYNEGYELRKGYSAALKGSRFHKLKWLK